MPCRYQENGWSQAFCSLKPFACAARRELCGLQRNKTSYSIPGEVGAVSKLFRLLTRDITVELTPEEWRRITLWLDSNSMFYRGLSDTVAQAKGNQQGQSWSDR